MRKGLLIAVLLAGGLAAGTLRTALAASDTWITTKAKIALLTTDGSGGSAVNVDTVDGKITIHGKVKTEAEKTKAASTVRTIDGVTEVKNLLQFVPEAERKMVKASDNEIKDKVSAALKADPTLESASVKVASVNDGVVLLSGKAKTLSQKLTAIESAHRVAGVRKVSSEIESDEK